MKPDTFKSRLGGGKVNNLVYSKDGNDGLVSVWMHESAFVLTWEECPQGEQYDESTYTRDERYTFSSLEDLLKFLSENDLALERFTS